ncbi:MAG: hypothetical protein IT531_09455 [Burkholderiales bacterium]|nr:hypothetical protein [Burkholderiales bacterium]
MTGRRNEYDVTNRVQTTDPCDVRAEIGRIFHALYPRQADTTIARAIDDAARLYRGEYPGYAACDTAYHDLQHTLDVSLAMARIMAGYVRHGQGALIDADLFAFGVMAALFHDAGYIRRLSDHRHANGAEYTKIHVSRGGRFLRAYLRKIGMDKFAQAAAPTLHFTGYEHAAEHIRVPDPIFRLIGNMLGSADIIAQMSDRCYLEKCYERLYPEFVLGGIDRKTDAHGADRLVFASARDLLFHTPQFYHTAMKRLHQQLDAMMRFAAERSHSRNLYVEEAEKNIQHARKLAASGDISALRRKPPSLLTPSPEKSDSR